MSARIAKQGLPPPPVKNRAKKLRTNKSHEAFIRSLPCLGCGERVRCEAAHVRMGTDGGMGLQPHARYLVPLCHGCHRTGPNAQHSQPETEFWANLGIDPTDVSLKLWAISGDEDRERKGEHVIFKARQRMNLNANKGG